MEKSSGYNDLNNEMIPIQKEVSNKFISKIIAEKVRSYPTQIIYNWEFGKTGQIIITIKGIKIFN